MSLLDVCCAACLPAACLPACQCGASELPVPVPVPVSASAAHQADEDRPQHRDGEAPCHRRRPQDSARESHGERRAARHYARPWLAKSDERRAGKSNGWTGSAAGSGQGAGQCELVLPAGVGLGSASRESRLVGRVSSRLVSSRLVWSAWGAPSRRDAPVQTTALASPNLLRRRLHTAECVQASFGSSSLPVPVQCIHSRLPTRCSAYTVDYPHSAVHTR